MTVMRKLKVALIHPGLTARFVLAKLTPAFTALSALFWSIIAKLSLKGNLPPISHTGDGVYTPVNSFWGEHTVIGPELARVRTAYQSKKYLEWRFSIYPLFKELMELWGNHKGQVILDCGCGPGNDLAGFLVHTKARKVIGIDISEKALQFASRRLALHRVNLNRVELIHTSDSANTIPIDDNSVDYIYCEGVLHHTSNPEGILKEFYRVLKPGSHACIMVYNRDSIWFHLYTAYEMMILQNRFAGMSVEEAFEKTTDTEECPIARCYRAQEFISICQDAGFKAKYAGGYLSLLELDILEKYKEIAPKDKRLGDEHRDFLTKLVFDKRSYPMYEGKYAGVGGVYRLYK